jgi:surfactin family lipopeptide synthetase A
MNILSNEEDIVVGNVSNNRPVIQDGDNIVGCFLNTVPVRLKIPYRKSWAYYIQAVEDKILKLRKYERMPLFEIAIIIGEKSKDKNPIFDTLFNFKDFHIYLRAGSTNEKKTTTGREIFSIPRSEDTNTLFDFEIDITEIAFTS